MATARYTYALAVAFQSKLYLRCSFAMAVF